MKFALSLLIGLVGAAASTVAAPIAYNINFIVADWFLVRTAPSGSFTYDATASLFTSFDVSWDGRSFNLVNAANAPELAGTCDTPAVNSADFFSYLSGNGCAPQFWGGFAGPRNSLFRVGGALYSPNGRAFAELILNEPGSGDHQTTGAFVVSAVPEPSSWALVLAGGALLAWRRRPGWPRHLD